MHRSVRITELERERQVEKRTSCESFQESLSRVERKRLQGGIVYRSDWRQSRLFDLCEKSLSTFLTIISSILIVRCNLTRTCQLFLDKTDPTGKSRWTSNVNWNILDERGALRRNEYHNKDSPGLSSHEMQTTRSSIDDPWDDFDCSLVFCWSISFASPSFVDWLLLIHSLLFRSILFCSVVIEDLWWKKFLRCDRIHEFEFECFRMVFVQINKWQNFISSRALTNLVFLHSDPVRLFRLSFSSLDYVCSFVNDFSCHKVDWSKDKRFRLIRITRDSRWSVLEYQLIINLLVSSLFSMIHRNSSDRHQTEEELVRKEWCDLSSSVDRFSFDRIQRSFPLSLLIFAMNEKMIFSSIDEWQSFVHSYTASGFGVPMHWPLKNWTEFLSDEGATWWILS